MKLLITTLLATFIALNSFAGMTITIRIVAKDKIEENFNEQFERDVDQEIFMSETTKPLAKLRILAKYVKDISNGKYSTDISTMYKILKWQIKTMDLYFSSIKILSKYYEKTESKQFKAKLQKLVEKCVDEFEFKENPTVPSIYVINDLLNDKNINIDEFLNSYIREIKKELIDWKFNHQK